MTTLIIHPKISIQRNTALSIAQDYLEKPIDIKKLPPDLHIIDGAVGTSIGIDDVKTLIKELQYQPYEAKYQIGLIFRSDRLTTEAQNALLKSLEEPGEQTIFILTTTHEQFLLPTIVSRARKVYVRENLDQEVPTQELEDCIKELPQSPAIGQFLERDIVDKFLEIEELVKKEKDSPGVVQDFLHELQRYFRIQLIEATEEKDITEIKHLLSITKKISKTLFFISKNANKRLALENLILQLEESIM
ncbi:hypothetical protein JW710_00265 [Candidatus Dojkabacteria bacterium]|nr:hypothetical protein [Candidatus Dojkabacteria bacterium]